MGVRSPSKEAIEILESLEEFLQLSGVEAYDQFAVHGCDRGGHVTELPELLEGSGISDDVSFDEDYVVL